jgi:hypothetical protein
MRQIAEAIGAGLNSRGQPFSRGSKVSLRLVRNVCGYGYACFQLANTAVGALASIGAWIDR